MARLGPTEDAGRQIEGKAALTQARRAARVRRAIEETMARRACGEPVPDGEVQRAHPDLMPELGRELSLLGLIERAREQAGAGVPNRDPSRMGSALRSSTDATGRAWSPQPLARDAFDGFEVLREAHRGGQGVVYEGVQKSTGRRVAIKVMREGLFAGERDAARFEREVRILGQLNHPGIVGILASGVRGGHFYYAMEYVEGEPIDRWAERQQPTRRDVLALFARVCDAVAAAHVRGIIHRDLKPANILVDERADPRVLDFGLARIVTDSDAALRMTMTGQFVGSMPWASPEQAAGDQSKVDVRTDVYSLGVILYQLLTGRFPYRIEGPPRDVLDNILTAEPARIRSIARGVEEDAEAIVLKCLAKERERRYQSASELADDLRRLLEGRAVIARPPSVSYHLRSFARRHRPLVIGAAAVLGVLTLGLVGTSLGLIEASAARRGLKRERDAALAAEEAAERGRAAAERQSYIASIAAADAALRAVDAGTARARLDAAPERLRGWEWSHLMGRADRSLGTIPGEYLDASPTPAGDGIVVIRTDGTASLLDASADDGSFVPLWTVSVPVTRPDDPAWRASVSDFSGDGRLIALSKGPELFVLEAPSGRVIRSWDFEGGAWGFMWSAFSPDGTRVAANGIEGRMRVWDIVSGDVLYERPRDREAWGVAYSPDGRFLGVDTRAGIEVLDAGTFEHVRLIPLLAEGLSEFLMVVFTPDGRHLVTLRGFSPLVIEVESGRVVARCEGHTQRIISLGFAPGGRLITCSWDRTIRLWDTLTGRQEGVLLGHAGETFSAGFFRKGTRIVSASADRTLRVWESTIAPDVERLTIGEGVWDLGITEQQHELIAECASGIRRWDAGSWTELERSALPPLAPGNHPAFSPDGRWIAYAPDPGSVSLQDDRTQRTAWTITGLGSPVYKVSFSPDRPLLAASHPESVRVLSLADGTSIHSYRARYTGARAAFVPGAPLLVVPHIDRGLMVCNVITGGTESIADGVLSRSHEVLAIACSPDGRLVASAHAGGIVVIWDVASRRPLRHLTGMDPAVWCVAFSPDGTRLATGSQDRMVRIWDPADGTELLVLRGHTGTVMSLAWSPDGRTLFSSGYDGTILRWDAP